MKRTDYILLDINTIQGDFNLRRSPRIRESKKILTNIRRVFAWTRLRKIQVISIIPEEKEPWQKLRYSLRNDFTTFEASNSTDLSIEKLAHDQIIFHNRAEDPFEEPKIERVLEKLKTPTVVVIGISKSIIPAVLGLLQREKKVIILEDITRFPSLTPYEIKIAKRKMQSKGAEITTINEFIKNNRSPICLEKIANLHLKRVEEKKRENGMQKRLQKDQQKKLQEMEDLQGLTNQISINPQERRPSWQKENPQQKESSQIKTAMPV